MSTIDQSPQPLDILVRRGDSFARLFTFKVSGVGIDVSDWTFAAQIREYAEADSATDVSFNEADAVNGNIYASITDTQLALLPEANVWDFEVVIDGYRQTFFAGSFTAEKDVTREQGS